jgi:hypothetical protein
VLPATFGGFLSCSAIEFNPFLSHDPVEGILVVSSEPKGPSLHEGAACEADLIAAREDLGTRGDAKDVVRSTFGVLRVSLPTAFGVRQIIPRLPGFLSLQPELKIEVMMSDRYEDLVAEGADLALPIGSQPDSHS